MFQRHTPPATSSMLPSPSRSPRTGMTADAAGFGAGDDLAGVEAHAGGAVEDAGGGDDLGEAVVVEVVDRGAVPAGLVGDAGVEGDPLGRVLAGAVPAEGDEAGDGAVGDDLREAVAVEVADRRGGWRR
jgi:hypothetical protein